MLVRSVAVILLVISALGAVPLQAQQPQSPAEPVEVKKPGWLGIWVEPMPAELKAQLAPLTQANEGLLVARVETGSPADRAGISRFDVVLSFAGQKLYDPEQLSSLVRSFNADSDVELTLIQKGQLKTVNTTLAQNRKKTLARTQRQPWSYPPMPRYAPPSPAPRNLLENGSVWDEFESVQVKTLPDGRYSAIVSYRDNSNEIKTFTFEGEKQEIIQQIKSLKELSRDKKQALLKALKFRPESLYGLNRYDFTRDLFESPLWRQNPFDHPFFQDPYFMHRPNVEPWWGRGYRQPWQFHLYPDVPDWNQRRH